MPLSSPKTPRALDLPAWTSWHFLASRVGAERDGEQESGAAKPPPGLDRGQVFGSISTGIKALPLQRISSRALPRAGHEDERKFHSCCLARSNWDLPTAAPLCWSLSRNTQPCSSPGAPGSTEHEVSEGKANVGQRVPVPMERRSHWEHLSAHLDLTAGLCLHLEHWDAALPSPVHPSDPFPVSLPRVCGFLCLSLARAEFPSGFSGFPAAKAANPEAGSQLHREGSECGVTELLHGSSREGNCGLNFQELLGPDSVLSHPIKNKHRAVDGPCSALADFIGPGMERVLGWSLSGFPISGGFGRQKVRAGASVKFWPLGGFPTFSSDLQRIQVGFISRGFKG